MSKKIALLLIMVLLVNMVAWSDVTVEEALEAGIPVWGIILIIFGIAALIGGVYWLMSEADAPDDGLMLVSNENTASTAQNSFDPALKILQHIEVNQTQENKLYVGLRFQY